MITLVLLAFILLLCILFIVKPDLPKAVLGKIRFLLGDTFGVYYLVIGLGIFLISIYVAFSRYGSIVLGNPDEKPKYSFFVWGSMMFTAGLAADILFYSFSEWLLYAVDPHIKELGSIQDWASVYPLFHWSLIPWGFYLILAVSFGFMLHVRKRKRQKYSEACRPILGKHTNGLLGRLIDLLAVFALLAGTATIFSLATPLMAGIINVVFHIQLSRNAVTIVILVVTCMIYTYSLGKQISGAANFIASYNTSGDLYGVIISMINTMPCAALVLILLLVTMIAFYATSFDSIALIASCYSYHELEDKQMPDKKIQLMWCILLILLPIALVFSDSSMSNLQSVSIIAAFPIGVVILLITVSFLKDARNYLDNDNK